MVGHDPDDCHDDAVTGVLIGFAIIATIVIAGYVIGRSGLLGDVGQPVLAKLVYFVLSPCLLFTVLADADIEQLFSPLLIVSFVAALICFAAYQLVAGLVWRRPVPEAMVGMLSAGYTNAGNIGIPVAAYVLGDAAFAAPVMLLQVLLIAPTALTVLDTATGGGRSVGRILAQPFRNPIIFGSAAGLLLTLTGIELPVPVMEPFRIIAGATVPLMLMGYGMSLHGRRPLRPGTGRRDVLLASSLKLLAMPVAAWMLGALVFGLSGHDLFVVVVLAALPTAQNVFNYAQRFERGETVARDTILVTTVASMPVLFVVAALLH